jgi:hypothetical protein
MSKSFIDFKERGYWMSDGFVELIANYLFKTIDSMEDKPAWMSEMQDQLYIIMQGGCLGWNSFEFDDLLISEERVHLFNSIILKTIEAIENKGEYILKSELNAFEEIKTKELKSLWTEDLDSQRLINLLKDISLLLKGEKGFSHEDPITYFW